MKYHWRRCVIFGLSAVVAVCSAVGAKNLFSAASAAETAVLAETGHKRDRQGHLRSRVPFGVRYRGFGRAHARPRADRLRLG